MSNLAQPVDDSAPIVVASVIAEEPISVEDDPVIPTAQAHVLTATTEDPYQLSPDTKTIQKDFESGTPIEPSGSPSQINPDFGVGEESIHSDLEQQKLEAFHSKKDEGAIDKSTGSPSCYRNLHNKRLYVVLIFVCVLIGMGVLIAVLVTTSASGGSSSSSSSSSKTVDPPSSPTTSPTVPSSSPPAVPTGEPPACTEKSTSTCPWDFTDCQLVSAAMDGNRIGKYCRVARGGPFTTCSYYVKGRASSLSGHAGIPRTANDELGTGCVSTGGYCFFYDERYVFETNAQRESMCTNDWIANAAAQLRWGMENGLCEDKGVDTLNGCTGSN